MYISYKFLSFNIDSQIKFGNQLKNKTLSEYRYLEHGAHYAILALAIIMLCKIFFHINEIIVSTLRITFIAVSAYHSIKANGVQIRVEEKVK